MTDKTAFEQWWLDQHGPNWSSMFTPWEKDRSQECWNAVIDAAVAICMEQQSDPECPERALYCAEEIQKLRSE